ncbi:hypothetical protein [Pleomorphomonas carboxyditropha]|uniref:Uncharacterized protein n=1 Tax=Pleomorphomonas carboxyditropha TaxID=2023338 RepID=A0A2G9WPD9_9HYPH|nr:hypothetical protein [Pleomorphomonas carboxyditropha]PIO96578.1 hypothetical protein CJ014_24760 [Pleomorphomonas carboxyditropha]
MTDQAAFSRRLSEGYTDNEWSVIAAIIGDRMPPDVEAVRVWMQAACFSVLVYEVINEQRDRSAEEKNYRDVATASAYLLDLIKAQPEFWRIAMEIRTAEEGASDRLIEGLEQLADVAAKNAAIVRKRGRPVRVARRMIWSQLIEFWRDDLGLPVTRSIDPITGAVTGRLENFLVAALAPACPADPPTLQAASDFVRKYRATNGQIFGRT